MSQAAILFPADPFSPRRVDSAFRAELEAADRAGIPWCLVDHDVLERRHDGQAALEHAKLAGIGCVAYRGWMVQALDYARLHQALSARGVAMLVEPGSYAALHHWPEAYPHVARHAACTRWIGAAELDRPGRLRECLGPFGNAAVIVKDWVKSQSGYWHEACYIPDAGDAAAVDRVVGRFLELQGNSLTGGLCFRQFHSLVAGQDGRPAEWRTFCVGGQVAGTWARDGSEGSPPPSCLVEDVCRSLPSPFATADFARRTDGGWLLLETGDGGVSAIPGTADAGGILRRAVAACPAG